MSANSTTFTPGLTPNTARSADGKVVTVPDGWILLPPGDAALTFANDRWWFGCYGDPKVLLVTDADFNLKGRYEFDCSLGIVGLPNGRFLSAGGKCEKDKGCTGAVKLAVADDSIGLKFVE